MVKDPKAVQLRSDKNKVIISLDVMKDMLAQCTATGMPDYESGIYNLLLELADEADAADNYLELAETMNKAKQIEHNLDTWLASSGMTTQGLQWPDIEREL